MEKEEYNAMIGDWGYEDYPGQYITGPQDNPPTFQEWLQQERETAEFFKD